MIIDIMDNWDIYFSGRYWNAIKEFLKTLSINTKDGEYPIIDNKIFARVMSYNNKTLEDAVYEAHRRYIDIQAVISGAEGIAWRPVRELTYYKPYDIKSDTEFYITPTTTQARVDVIPGYFVVLFPSDAHMPQLKVVNMPDLVKKVVIKVPLELHSQVN